MSLGVAKSGPVSLCLLLVDQMSALSYCSVPAAAAALQHGDELPTKLSKPR